MAVAQTALDAVTVVLICAIGRRVAGPLTGLLAAAFYGLYPYLLFQNLTVNDTAVFIFLLALGIWLAYRVRDSRRWLDTVALGAVFGRGALTKTLIVLVCAAGAVVVAAARSAGRSAGNRGGCAGDRADAVGVRTRLQGVRAGQHHGEQPAPGNNACVAISGARLGCAVVGIELPRAERVKRAMAPAAGDHWLRGNQAVAACLDETVGAVGRDHAVRPAAGPISGR